MSRGDIRLPNAGVLTYLNALSAILAGKTARLYANNLPFDPANPPSAYVEASFPGYVPVSPLAWAAPAPIAGGFYQIQSQSLVFWSRSQVAPAPVYGIYVTDFPVTEVFLVIPFLEPYTFDSGDIPLVQQIDFSIASVFN